MGGRVRYPFSNRSEMWYFPMDWYREYGGRTLLNESNVKIYYVGFFNGWSDSETTAVIHGQVVNLGIQGGMNDGVEVLRQPCRSPKSVMPPHWVIIRIFLTIVIPM